MTTGGDDGNGVGSARSGAGGSVESLDAHVTRCSRGCGQPSLAFSAGFNGLDALLAVGDRTRVLFVGYQGEGTPGRRIRQAAERGGRVFIDGEDVPVRARIETLKGLSAHADRKELRAWLDAVPNVRRVALHHGDIPTQEAFASWLG